MPLSKIRSSSGILLQLYPRLELNLRCAGEAQAWPVHAYQTLVRRSNRRLIHVKHCGYAWVYDTILENERPKK